jgi:hypothetical protein
MELPKVFKWILLILVLSIVVMTLPVLFLGPFWHWINGDFIYYHQQKVRVESSFFVYNKLGRPSLWKLPVGFPLWHDPYAVIAFSDLKRPFEYEEDYQKFMNGSGRAADAQGYQFLKEVSIGTNVAHCLEYGLPGNAAKSFAQCTVEHTDLLISFRGHAKYFPLLISTINSISEQQK